MDKQVGAVLVFKEGVSEKEAALALQKIKELLAGPPQIASFNPDWGGPVWYVP